MKNKILTEFRPAIRFVGIFASIYLAGNVLYGVFIEWYRPQPDPATVVATRQSVAIINLWSEPTESKILYTEPNVLISTDDKVVLRVFEGCNGLNVMIVFVAFIIAFGGERRKQGWFVVVGLVVIHAANLVRINLLYFMARHQPTFFYYFHKYLFTACIYVVVFLLWYLWVSKIANKSREHAPA